MDCLKCCFVYFFSLITRWLNKPKIVKTNIHISWADFVKTDKSLIILYKTNPCKLCEEIELFLENNLIPYVQIKCKRLIPLRITNRRDLDRYIGFRGKETKDSKILFLPPAFPQLDLMENGGKWIRIVGNVNLMRNKVDEFIQKNIKDFPGFERGIYGDKDPAQQAAEQVQRAMETDSKKGPFV